MGRLASWMVVVLLIAVETGARAGGAPAAWPAGGPSRDLSEYQRNLTLGSELAERQGTAEELASLQALADRGVKIAREAVRRDPKSPEAQAQLSNWLLYGYRVIQADRITYDRNGEEHVDKVPRVVQGLSGDQSEGLSAAKRAQELAPRSGRFLVDYGAALLHCGQGLRASAVLKRTWVGDVQTSSHDKIRAAMLISDADGDRGDLLGARGWLYRALAENRDNTGIVARLRDLDRRQSEATRAAPPVEEQEGGSAASEESPQEQVTPEAGATAEEGVIIETPESEAPAASEAEPAAEGAGGSSSQAGESTPAPKTSETGEAE